MDRFTIYASNLVPTYAVDSAYYIMAGVKYATTFATQVTKVETLRSEKTFGDLMRGLMVFGRKVIKPEGLALLYAKKG